MSRLNPKTEVVTLTNHRGYRDGLVDQSKLEVGTCSSRDVKSGKRALVLFFTSDWMKSFESIEKRVDAKTKSYHTIDKVVLIRTSKFRPW